MISIIDFGSQFAHLISKKIRSLGEYTQILPPSITSSEIKQLSPSGIIMSGGPDSVYNKNGYHFDEKIFDLNIPILGICFGYQLIAYLRGGDVIKGSSSEYGITQIEITTSHSLFRNLDRTQQVLMSHGDIVVKPPIHAEFLAKTKTCSAAYADDINHIYGIQFHPEVVHTPNGIKILSNFLDICLASRDWSTGDFIDQQIKNLSKYKSPIIMAVSGGVDSTVAASLLQKAVPELLHCVFVDTGLMRKDEAKEINEVYSHLFTHYYSVNAKDFFYKNLKGIINPEEKRKIIGNTFISIFEGKARELEKEFGKFVYLGQGTIYSDRVESAATSNQASIIKTHHNVGGLPEKMDLKLIEPLADLYKNEVREVGKKIGIDHKLLNRHPFPGPGLAIRCLGEVTPDRIKIIQEADAILQQMLKDDQRIDYDQLWQVFFVLLADARTVGVMGDARTYEHPGIIRIVESMDAMTATVPNLPLDLLIKIANEIVNKVKGINRVCLDLTSKPPGTIEWE